MNSRKAVCNYIKWNETTENWTVHNYFIRKIDHLNEEIIEGDTIVLTINLTLKI